jgi:hypothetical protein
MKLCTLIVAACALAGCATSETVRLRSASGMVAVCGPYTAAAIGPLADVSQQIKLRDCVSDYQRQGFERAP